MMENIYLWKAAPFVSGLPKQVAMMGKHILKPLNRVQQKAVFKTMMAEKFVLLKGMPGSGKTTMTGWFVHDYFFLIFECYHKY